MAPGFGTVLHSHHLLQSSLMLYALLWKSIVENGARADNSDGEVESSNIAEEVPN